MRHLARTESTPPAWYALGWLVHHLGASAVDVRLLSVFAGALLAAAVVVYARTMLPLWASALAGLGVALGYQFVFHGRELRAYELHALLSVALAIAASAFVRNPSGRRALWLGLAVAVGSLTHYFFMLSLAAVLLWLWTSPTARSVRRRGTIAVAAGLVPWVFWSPVFAFQYRHHRFSFIGPSTVTPWSPLIGLSSRAGSRTRRSCTALRHSWFWRASWRVPSGWRAVRTRAASRRCSRCSPLRRRQSSGSRGRGSSTCGT